MKQLTSKEMKERGEKFPPNSVQATKITERILNFIVMAAVGCWGQGIPAAN